MSSIFRYFLVLTVFLLSAGQGIAGGGIARTKHNLSTTGPGEVRSHNETEICSFCHGDHLTIGIGPMWGREGSDVNNYEPYQSSTLAVQTGQPDGSSKLCLSCHDGTIALGAIRGRSREIFFKGTDAGGRMRSDKRTTLGTDLSGSHPISMGYGESLRSHRRGAFTTLRPFRSSAELGTLLDTGGKVQCTSCHDPHRDSSVDASGVPPFWRGDSPSSPCEVCHEAPILLTGHADDKKLTAGCGSCHVGHGVSRQPLLPASEEEACFKCHGSEQDKVAEVAAGRLGTSARPVQIDDLFQRAYRHPVEADGGEHVPGEEADAPEKEIPRHAECADCHQTHGVTEIDLSDKRASILARRGRSSDEVPGEERCMDCHGRVDNLPPGQTDKTLEFGAEAISAHPVDRLLVTGASPSLVPPWLSGDLMNCSDCHGAEDGDHRKGPHGSKYPWILKADYEVNDGSVEAPDVYSLCYECHNRRTILTNETFAGHSEHVSQARVSCYACHDSHGSLDYPGLIRFGKDARFSSVSASSSGRLEYLPEEQACYLICHDVDHNPLGYQ